MYESLLLNVSKYAASDKTSPIENFVTEAFAWLLKNDEDTREAILKLVQTKSSKKGPDYSNSPDDFDISTQMNFNGKFPDMVWKDNANDWVLVFEHKVWSELHEDQLYNYRQYADVHYPNYELVLITARSWQHCQSPDIALCWYEIENALSDIKCKNEKQKWLIQEFHSLLKGNGLLSVSPIDPLSLNYYSAAKAIDSQLRNICDAFYSIDWPLNSFLNFNMRRKIDSRWERVGVEFTQYPDLPEDLARKPSVFMGFLQSGGDHLVTDLVERGPVATLIISFGQDTHSVYPNLATYKQLVAELQSNLEISKTWNVHDRTELPEYNKWHPIIIEAGLFQLFKDCNSIDSQQQRYIVELQILQKALISCAAFEELCCLLKPQV